MSLNTLAEQLNQQLALGADPFVVLRAAALTWPASSSSEVDALACMLRSDTVHSSLLRYALRSACGFEAVPGASAVVAWLREHSATLCDITALDLSTCALVYSDWSVTAADFIPPEQYDDAAEFTARIWAEMRAVGAAAAIGGYDHIRPSYGGALFQADQAESRTVHIGLDIFMDAGTPLFAPLDGMVHSLAFNDAKFDYGPCVVLQHTVDSALPVFYTLYGHLDLPSLAALHPGQAIRAGTQFARMGDFPENGDWPPHVHVQLILDMLDKRGDFNGSCKPSQRDVWLSLCPDANLITRVPNALFPSVPVTARCAVGEAATIVQRAGGWRYDACGQRTRD